MLEALGCCYVIVGHSERRKHFGETDQQVNRKVRAALCGGLRPILCVGEEEEERAGGRLREVIRRQVSRALDEYPAGQARRLAVAYEPVWAIGTGKAASPEDAVEAHQVIRRQLEKILGQGPSEAVRILYGGSVTGENVAGFAARPEVDGVLVGGASLKPADFAAIVRGGWEAPGPGRRALPPAASVLHFPFAKIRSRPSHGAMARESQCFSSPSSPFTSSSASS